MWDSIKESDRTLRSVSLVIYLFYINFNIFNIWDCSNFQLAKSLNLIMQIFIPIVASVHIYLIVVDLRETNFVIIDNSKTHVPMDIKYGDMPNIEYILIIQTLKHIYFFKISAKTYGTVFA